MEKISYVPELSIEMIESGRVFKGPYPYEHYSGREITDLLDSVGYTNLGWMNDYNSTATKLRNKEKLNGFREVYSDWTGSYCVYIDDYRRYYCVDMGD